MSIEIISAKNFSDSNSQVEFYKTVFPDRKLKSFDYWNWLYKGSLNNNDFPLLAVNDKQVIGQAGGIPIKIKINNAVYQTAWFNDFNILPQHQGKGIGKQLTEAWMKQFDIGITYCNDNSIQVFKKYGWEESFQTNFHTIFIKPFNHPKIKSKIPSILGNVGNKIYQSTQVKKSKNISLTPIKESKIGVTEESFGTIRDDDFWAWRIHDSPDSNQYYITERKSIIKLCRNSYGNYIDILFANKLDNDFLQELNELRYYGLKNNFDFIRLLCPNNTLSAVLKRVFKSYLTHPRFAFFANDEQLKNDMRTANWNWQLIDSDFEKFL